MVTAYRKAEAAPREPPSAREGKPVSVDVDLDFVARSKPALQQGLRQRGFEGVLDRPLQGPGAIHRIESRLTQSIDRSDGNIQSNSLLRETLPQQRQLDLGFQRQVDPPAVHFHECGERGGGRWRA